tara:strand:- start:518 stop:823 length:306 start_codon:yes stop_codon:yes gene_type:complete
MKSADTKEARFAEGDYASLLEYLPQEMRAKLTGERLALLMEVGDLQSQIVRLKAELSQLPKDYQTRQAIAGALGEERGAHNTTLHLIWIIGQLRRRSRRGK